MRLRPSGGKGPLATQFSAFKLYQASEAETWEHMALTRARVVAGEPGLAAEIGEAIAARPLPRATGEARARRARDAQIDRQREGRPRPLGPQAGRGGLIDIEFVAQFLTLAHAHDHPGLLGPSTRAVIAKASARGLIAPDDAAALADAHRLYTDATEIMRLAVAGPFDPAKAARGVKRRIAAAAALPDFELAARGGRRGARKGAPYLRPSPRRTRGLSRAGPARAMRVRLRIVAASER